MNRLTGYFLLLLTFAPVSGGATISDGAEPAEREYESETDTASDTELNEDSFIPQIDQLFKNPAVISGLQSTANAINRSVESLMDSLFYSLLDNQLRHPVSPGLFYGVNTSREVYNTARGAYVVVDRFFFGPEARKELGNIATIPVSLGAYTHTDIVNIYLRTDAQRLSEEESLPGWRYWVNNWFGAIPFLAAILPPSFNPNQMYDPLSLLETPFSFPLTKKDFDSMAVGSIRSYGLSGGVSLPFDLSQLNQSHKTFLETMDLKTELPYAIFVQGEYRINVLRRTETTAWVGLTRVSKSGHSLNGFAGNSFFLLAGAVRQLPWKGFPAVLAPVDFNWSLSDILQTDQLYEFDMTNEMGTQAYQEAVRGNFTLAADMAKEPGKQPVIWHFSRNKDSLETDTDAINSYFILRNNRQTRTATSEIAITDPAGRYYVLENTFHLSDNKWDILIGSEEVTTSMVSEMNVNKFSDEDSHGSGHYYTFKKEAPYHLSISLNIKDRDADVEEYHSYIELLKTFSQLPLDEVPRFSLRSEKKQEEYRRKAFFSDPAIHSTSLHVPVSSLGRFNATALIHFDTRKLKTIWSQSRENQTKTLLSMYGAGQLPYTPFPTETLPRRFLRYLGWPLRFFQIYMPALDAFAATDHQVESLGSFREDLTPEELTEVFAGMFNTNYPAETSGALIHLAGIETVPRKVTFYVKPGKHAEPEHINKLKNLNEKTFQGQANFPALQRYQIARDKLTVFFPTNLRETRPVPVLDHIAIDSDEKESQNSILVTLRASHLGQESRAYIYIRLETSGKLQLGNLVLGQEVVRLLPEKSEVSDPDKPVLSYRFYLTGPDSPLAGLIFNQLIDIGGEFLLSVSVSDNGTLWSKEKSFRFRYLNGELLPPETPP